MGGKRAKAGESVWELDLRMSFTRLVRTSVFSNFRTDDVGIGNNVTPQ